ncbi:hypothetical protein GGU10DRAFT_376926 [Lentinula aff. detonsa]|uniref:Uncharacterized protein n=1 Tax=Lentinula aff. detonsa TaxID=2804958 RepID=A0AA38NIP1_9AGAR|nr:hypothetical protein GGU10DRAFT_376926 [Lentinula aff. detonsa]
MSTTSSPMHPACSATPVLNEEDVQLQAFLVAAKREAQEKWERLRLAKASEVVERVGGEGSETIVAEGNVQEDVAEVEKEVILKIEARPRKVITRMVAGFPRSREVIPIKRRITIVSGVAESSRKRRKGASAAIIVNSDSDSLPVPFPNPCERCLHGDQVCHPQPHAPNAVACDQCHVARQSCSFLQKVRKLRVRSPPSEAEVTGMKEEM